MESSHDSHPLQAFLQRNSLSDCVLRLGLCANSKRSGRCIDQGHMAAVSSTRGPRFRWQSFGSRLVDPSALRLDRGPIRRYIASRQQVVCDHPAVVRRRRIDQRNIVGVHRRSEERERARWHFKIFEPRDAKGPDTDCDDHLQSQWWYRVNGTIDGGAEFLNYLAAEWFHVYRLRFQRVEHVFQR